MALGCSLAAIFVTLLVAVIIGAIYFGATGALIGGGIVVGIVILLFITMLSGGMG